MKTIKVTLSEVQDFIETLPSGVAYGVPRGGRIIALLAAVQRTDIVSTDDIQKADYVIDDVVDSGATRERYRLHEKPFIVMHEKNDDTWVEYPWEGSDPLRDNEDTVRRQLELIGEDPKREGLIDTPKRYLKAMQEMTRGYHLKAEDVLKTQFDEAGGYDQVVVLKNIDFTSLCEHHILPFMGTASVAYLPGKKVVGISKLARLVEMHAHRLQIQERLTADVANDLVRVLEPKGVFVRFDAHHTCMGCRGVRKMGATMVTSSVHGIFKDDPSARAEVLELLK